MDNEILLQVGTRPTLRLSLSVQFCSSEKLNCQRKYLLGYSNVFGKMTQFCGLHCSQCKRGERKKLSGWQRNLSQALAFSMSGVR